MSFQYFFRPAITAFLLGVCSVAQGSVTSPVTQSSITKGDIGQGRVGLFDIGEFRLSSGHCADCNASPQALWYFQDDLVATPLADAAGLDPTLRVQDDVRSWAQQFSASNAEKPALLWLGSPHTATGVLSHDGTTLTLPNQLPEQQTLSFSVVEKIPANLSYYDDSSVQYFAGRTLQMRGTLTDNQFVARTLWPADFALDFSQLPLQPLQEGESLETLVRADGQQPEAALAARLLWQKNADAPRDWYNKPVLAVLLNGAQGDDDEAHGGHFALATGAFGPQGEWNDWLVNNFYSLGSISEKGIIAAMLPLDAYMADLNSGQSWYRPSYMLVAVLKQPRAAQQVQGALARVYNHFYQQRFQYHHAMANCTGISMDTLRSLGWHIPERGATSTIKALAALPFMAIKERSLASGEQAFDYLMAEQTNLYPFVGFDAIGRDLLERISTGKAAANGLEALLAEDIEALLYVRIPQFPSSRAMGREPVASLDEYMSRVPENRADWKIIPVPPRIFPAELKDPTIAAEPLRPSQVATFAYAGVLGFGALGAWHYVRRRRSN